MELRDYLTALRRSGVLLVLMTLAGLSLAAAWLSVAPRQYVATAVVVVVASDPQTITDAQQGSQLAIVSAQTAAAVIDSPAVLGPVASELAPPLSTGQVTDAVTATARTGTAVVDIGASMQSAELAADVANRAADSAVTRVPGFLAGGTEGSGSPVEVTVIQPAAVPTEPVSPNLRGVLAIGLIVGVAAGIALAILRYALDNRVRGVSDLRQHGIPVLAAIPRLSRSQRGTLPVRDNSLSPAGEAFRVLRTNLESVSREESRSFVVAPVTASNDASDIVADLGWSLADAYRATVIVDLDLRNPRLHSLLETEDAAGVADVLQQRADIADVIAPTSRENLSVVPAGSTTASPSDLLSSPLLADLIDALMRRFDYVLLRSPAVLRYSDAATIARVASGTVLTVRNDHDRRVDVGAALDALSNVGVTPLGVVLAGAPSRRVSRTTQRLSPGPTTPPARTGAAPDDVQMLLGDFIGAEPPRTRRRGTEETLP